MNPLIRMAPFTINQKHFQSLRTEICKYLSDSSPTILGEAFYGQQNKTIWFKILRMWTLLNRSINAQNWPTDIVRPAKVGSCVYIFWAQIFEHKKDIVYIPNLSNVQNCDLFQLVISTIGYYHCINFISTMQLENIYNFFFPR